jgi:hypothetical protein
MAGEEDVPPENSTNLPALRPQGTQLVVVRPGNRLVSRIAGDAYRHLPSPSEKLWRVGEYEVSEQSYRQIMIWLSQIRKSGNEITLAEFLCKQETMPWGASVEWIKEGEIRQIQLNGYSLEQIDLSYVPYLTHLSCHDNKISRLDLHKVPMLKYLKCCDNMFFELDLSYVDKLQRLICTNNKLHYLNVRQNPLLFDLIFDDNIINKIEISNCYMLDYFSANNNLLTHLDLSQQNNLYFACINNNLLESIELPIESNLDTIMLLNNKIEKLDLSNCKALTSVYFNGGKICGFEEDAEKGAFIYDKY